MAKSKGKRNVVEMVAKIKMAWTPEKRCAHAKRLASIHAANPERWEKNRVVTSESMKRRWKENPEVMRSYNPNLKKSGSVS